MFALPVSEVVRICRPGNNGPCTDYFGLGVDLPQEVKGVLRREWTELLAWQEGISNEIFGRLSISTIARIQWRVLLVLPPPELELRKHESKKTDGERNGGGSGNRRILGSKRPLKRGDVGTRALGLLSQSALLPSPAKSAPRSFFLGLLSGLS